MDINNNFYFDFSDSELGQMNGSYSVDSQMSDISMNPVSNAVIKRYVDSTKAKITTIFATPEGKHAHSSAYLFSEYDFLIFYASSYYTSTPSCHCVPIRYLKDAGLETMTIKVADNDVYTEYTFTQHGFYIETPYNDTRGKVFALYGVKF